MTQKLYSIRNWNEIFENSRSRDVAKLRFVSVSNRHDGECYSHLIIAENGAEIYAAWMLILQVASKSTERGTLVRGNGRAHTPKSLSIITRAPEKWFEIALEYLESETDWLEVQEVAPERHPSAVPNGTHLPIETAPVCRMNRIELNRIEDTVLGLKKPEPTKRPKAPSLDEVKAQAELKDLPESEAVAFFDHHEARSWVSKGTKITKWKYALGTWQRNFKAGRFSDSKVATGSKRLSPTETISLSKRIEEIDNRIRNIADEFDYDTADRSALRAERKKLIAEKRRIESRVNQSNEELLKP